MGNTLKSTDDPLFNFPKLEHFAIRHGYELLDYITYNSYRTGTRSEVREYDSISVTEVLSVLQDPTIEFLDRFHGDKLKEAQEYGTQVHEAIDKGIKGETVVSINNLPTPIEIQFKLFQIKEQVVCHESEVHGQKEFGSLPLVTGMVDALGTVRKVEHIIDWKISKKDRNFKSIKYQLQAAGYRWLFEISNSMIVYINQKGYSIAKSKDIEYYDALWLELLGYVNMLYESGAKHNLHSNI